MDHQTIIFTNQVAQTIQDLLPENGRKIFIICDDNTAEYVLPQIAAESRKIADATVISTRPGDGNKNLDSLSSIWKQLQKNGADRHSIVVNLGGGVITDMGGFAAATFKRGLRFINIPTTLLSAVDAAVGGKTGINFNGLKNEIGAFQEADAVIISTIFFKTLPTHEIKSGYAEMLKHGLLENDEAVARLLGYDLESLNIDNLLSLLEESVNVKRRIVEEDPHEKNIRKALNLGHTAGHAFESLALSRNKPIPHGYAVAWGCVVELVLSHLKLGFPSDILHDMARFIRENYGAPDINCQDYDTLLELMRHDKKNSDGKINFTLLKAPGDIRINCYPTDDEIRTSLDIFRDLMGI